MHKLETARDAGDILRYHGWPTIQQQTNAHHTWNVMRIYAELFGWPIAEVAVYIQYHDVGELDTGDVSFVVKQINPEIREILKPIENESMQRLSMNCATPDMLGDVEKVKVKICDLFEMLEFSLKEMRLGNLHYGWGIFENIYDVIVPLARKNAHWDALSKINNLYENAKELRK